MLKILCALGLVCCLSSGVLAGFVVEKKVSTRNFFGALGNAETLIEYYDTELGRYATGDAIMRFDTGEVIVLNHDDRTFYRNTLDGYCADIEMFVSEMMNSPEYQQMLKMTEQMNLQMQKDAGKPQSMERSSPVLVKLGREKVAGYAADHYQVKVGKEIQHQVWLASDSRLDALDMAKNKQLKQSMKDFEKKFARCAARFSQMSPAGLPDMPKDPLEDLTAFELRSIDDVSETLTTGIREKKLSAATFEPPPTYRRVPLRELMSQDEDAGFRPDSSASEPLAAEQKSRSEDVEQAPAADEIENQVKQGLKQLKGLFGN